MICRGKIHTCMWWYLLHNWWTNYHIPLVFLGMLSFDENEYPCAEQIIIFLYSSVTPQIKYLFLNRCTQIFYPKPSMRKLGIKILDWIHAKTSQLIMIWKNWSWFWWYNLLQDILFENFCQKFYLSVLRPRKTNDA